MNPTSKPLHVKLGGRRYKLHFDLNTFAKFEEVTGRHFLEFLANMQEALASIATDRSPLGAFGVLKKVAMKDLQAFVFAALHEYDRNDEPVWPLTMGQMGKLVTVENMVDVIRLVLRGNAENAPTSEDVQTEAENPPARPTNAGASTPANGGDDFGPSDEAILASLTPHSGA